MFTAAGFAKALAYWKLFLQGVVCTVCLSFLTVLFGFLLALLITGMRMSDFRPFRALALTRDGHERDEGFLAKLSRFNPIRFIASVYVELFRATPMVVQIMLVYYGLFNGVKVLPGFMLFGFIRFERFFPGVVALALNSGAYLSEIIRSGIQSIDGGQTEASRSLGMSKLQTMRFIILPQAIRNILPAIANEFVTIIKESAICFTIGVQDIMAAVDGLDTGTDDLGQIRARVQRQRDHAGEKALKADKAEEHEARQDLDAVKKAVVHEHDLHDHRRCAEQLDVDRGDEADGIEAA